MAKAKKRNKAARETARTRRSGANARGVAKATKAAKGSRRPTESKAPARRGLDGRSLTLRDLLRSGIPRSTKAPQTFTTPAPSPFARRRTRSAHGLKFGSTLIQAQPRPREWVGVMKPGITKR